MRTFLPLLTFATVFAAVFVACSDGKKNNTVDVDAVKKLQRGELAAVAAYDEVLAKIGAPAKSELTRIRDEHKDAANKLGERVTALGATPETSGGVWESFAETWTKIGTAFSDNEGLRALEAGEKHGQGSYDSVLKNDAVDAKTKDLVRDTLRPRLDEHLRALASLKKSG